MRALIWLVTMHCTIRGMFHKTVIILHDFEKLPLVWIELGDCVFRLKFESTIIVWDFLNTINDVNHLSP